MKHYKMLSEKEYRMLKTVLDSGVSTKKASDLFGRSASTMHYIRRSTNFADYHRSTSERLKVSNARAKAKREGTTPEKVQLPLAVPPAPSADQQFDFKLLNENIVLLAKKLDEYTTSVQQLTISTYALRKTHLPANPNIFTGGGAIGVTKPPVTVLPPSTTLPKGNR